MRRDKGKPSGVNKSGGTGVPVNINDSKMQKDDELTREHTVEDNKPNKEQNPNRNTDKPPATNIGGYRG